jgi:hypothetical protein
MFSNLLAHPNRPNVAKNKFNMPHKSLHDKEKLSEIAETNLLIHYHYVKRKLLI